MLKISCLFMIWIACGSVSCNEEDNGFVQALDFGPIFNGDDSGIASLASSPIAAALLKVDKSQYPQLFDTVVSSSIDSLQSRVAPRESVFDASNFGFNPIASQSFLPYGKPAQIVAQHQPNSQNVQLSPLRYDIRTIHDPNYRVYKTESEVTEGKEILAALKKNPTVAAYFQPNVNVEVNHPIQYRKEELIEKFEGEQNYKQNPYLAGPARIRRYTGGRSRENLKEAEDDDDEDDPYNYRAEYVSKPKAFDESPYSSPYKKKKKSDDKYEYPYSYDSGYDHKEYERIKELSEQQAAEIKQNPGNCKEVKKDGMSCMTCKDPKTGGNYESCSYVAEPKNNQYAYSKEKKFDSNDEPDEDEDENSGESTKAEKIQKASVDETAPQKFTESKDKPYSSYRQADKVDDSGEKYKAFYVHSSKPKTNEALKATSDDSSEDAKPKSYDYNKALPDFYTDNEPKKDVEHVLAEFKKKDRSACKKVQKNSMTCFQCVDKNGQKNEECMFVSESAPKQSHLAYQEVKEFGSKPASGSNEAAESQVVATSATPPQKSAAYVASTSNRSKKLKRKKTPQVSAAASSPIAKTAQKVKRSEGSEAENNAKIIDVSNIGRPEDFAGAESKAAFSSEVEPRYSATLGVTLPEYMLSRSEHEASFDEAVAGA
ncbi:unnamed protein product, partial [Brenthis ino]